MADKADPLITTRPSCLRGHGPLNFDGMNDFEVRWRCDRCEQEADAVTLADGFAERLLADDYFERVE